MFGVWAPPGAPDAIVKRLSDEIATTIRSPGYVAKYRGVTQVEPFGTPPADLHKQIESDRALYGRVAQRIGFQPS